MSGDGSTLAFIIETDGVDPKTGQTSAHYYAPTTATPVTPATPITPAAQTNIAYTQEVVQTTKPKPTVVYTQEAVALPSQAPTQSPPAQTATAVAIPSKFTQQYPVIPDQPPAIEYQSQPQYATTQYKVEEQYPYTPVEEYTPPQYNTHPCVIASIALLFLVVIGVGIWFGLKLYNVI